MSPCFVEGMPVQSKWQSLKFDPFSIFNGGRIVLNKPIYLLLVSVGSHSSNAKKKNILNVFNSWQISIMLYLTFTNKIRTR